MKERKRVRGSTVVEMAYIMPMFLLLFVLVVNTVFFFHDKVILNGAACETAVLGSQRARLKEKEKIDLEGFFMERIKGKLVRMTDVSVSVSGGDKEVTVEVRAKRGGMSMSVCQKAVTARPEEMIRWKR